MQFHASLPPPRFGLCPRAETKDASQTSDFRNMFSSRPGMVKFAGYGEGHEDKTLKMLERLAVRITREGEALPGESNLNIPAGYTYLAQMVGHDIVHSVPGTIDVTAPQPPTRNLRTARMVLDTIYGRGPTTSPAAYAVSGRSDSPRTRLRLGKCRIDGARPAGGPALDIPRTKCPHLDNQPDRGATEVLLSDPRNDVSLILSQMTVIFHLLHNRVETVLAHDDERSGRTGAKHAAQRFTKARKVAAFVFRSIVDKDLMSRLITPISHDRLRDALESSAFLDDDDERLPLEFSHAAYRIGHSMVRGTYVVNDDQPLTGVKDIVRFTSARRPHEMPLSSDWLVQWSRFFTLTSRSPSSSQVIRPAVATALGVNDLFATQDDKYGGLVLRDLVRGADAGQYAVASLITMVPKEELTDPFLADPAVRAERIAEWLCARSAAADGDDGFSEKDIELLSKDPPLLFFILMEAEVVQAGQRLGPLGSLIVGETVYRALHRTKSMIEDDPETLAAVKTVFGPDDPGTMPELIEFLVSAGDLPSDQTGAPGADAADTPKQ